MSSSEIYHIRVRGNVLGPFRREQVVKLIERGQVTRMHEVSCNGSDWQPAGDREELFPRPAAPVMTTLSTAAPVKAVPPTPEQSPDAIAWFYERDGRPHGPISFSELTELIKTGLVGPEVRVWSEGMRDWQPVHATNLAVYLPSAQSESARWSVPSWESEGTLTELPPQTVQLFLQIKFWSGIYAAINTICAIFALIVGFFALLAANEPLTRLEGAFYLLSAIPFGLFCYVFAANSYIGALKYRPTIVVLNEILSRWWTLWLMLTLAYLVLVALLVFVIISAVVGMAGSF